MPRRRRATVALVAALAVVYVVWGSTYLGIAVAIETIPPLLMGAARFLLAGALLYAVASRFGDRDGDRPGRREWLGALVSGGAMLGVANGSLAVAEQTVATGICALVIASVPLWMALFDRLFFGQRLSSRAVIGLVVGFGGIGILVQPALGGSIDAFGIGLLLISSVAWAGGSLYARGGALPRRPLVGAAMQMIGGGVFLTLAGALKGELGDVAVGEISGRSVVAFSYLVVFGSLLGFTAYAWLLRVARTSLVATYAYVNPVVAVAPGWAVLGEAVTARLLVAGTVVVVAVALIVTARTPAEPEVRRLPRRFMRKLEAEAA